MRHNRRLVAAALGRLPMKRMNVFVYIYIYRFLRERGWTRDMHGPEAHARCDQKLTDRMKAISPINQELFA